MPEGLTDEAGEIVWEYSYQLLGKLIQETEYISVQQKLQYQGLYLDREPDCIIILSGTTIRIQITLLPESIGLEDRLNLYKYVENPLIYINLLGLTGCNRKPGKNLKITYWHKGLLEDYLSKNIQNGKLTKGTEFLKNIEMLRDSAKLVYVGQGQ